MNRALLTAILTRAYGHAARHWARLREIAATGIGLLPLESHEDFEPLTYRDTRERPRSGHM
jgi:hypothetical protein